MRIFKKASFLLCCAVAPLSANETLTEVRNVINSFMGDKKIPLNVQLSGDPKSNKCYKVEFKENKIHIQGNTGVALCRGFYDFAKAHQMGINSWSGNRFTGEMHAKGPLKLTKTAPFLHHYYLNVVTFGYTTPYWDWARWSKEIDWMALHGMDMPLALVAQEAIMIKVFKKHGLTDEEISAYLGGPAHLPWVRMGNISSVDGPLTEIWHQEQIKLQHKILKKMRALGMKPICPGFAGFVPSAFKRVHPEVKLFKAGWGGGYDNYMIDPEAELFVTMGKEFIQEWEKEFGKCDYYIADSFNEMEVPFPPKGTPERERLLNKYGEQVFKAINQANPTATWVIQGWMFGYSSHIWDKETYAGLTKKVPDDQMMILDLAVDYNKYFWGNGYNWNKFDGFLGKQWVYSVIPNMGGNTPHTGSLEFYANNKLEVLQSPNKGRLVGFGTAPEGIENNEVLYEMIADSGWTDKKINVSEWLSSYSSCRYGINGAYFIPFWDKMLVTIYGGFADHPRFNWQFRPGATRRGWVQYTDTYGQAIKEFLAVAPKAEKSPLYRADLAELTAMYLGMKLEMLSQQIDDNFAQGKIKLAKEQSEAFKKMMMAMDRMLVGHPVLTMEHWLSYPAAWDRLENKKDHYVSNAKKLVSVWGPCFEDYSSRVWSGLIRDYYLQRWTMYFENKFEGKKHNIFEWEYAWPANGKPLTKGVPFEDIVSASKEWIAFADKYVKNIADSDKNKTLGMLDIDQFQAEKPLSFKFSLFDYKKAKKIRLIPFAGKPAVNWQAVYLMLDGQRYDLHVELNFGEPTFSRELPESATANNQCELFLQAVKKEDAKGSFKIIFENE